MNIEKFISLYWWLVTALSFGGIGGLWTLIRARRAAKRARKIRQQEEAEELRRMTVEAATYWEPSAEENIVQLNRAAGLIEEILSVIDDPAIGSLLEVQLQAGTGIDVRTKCEDFLAQLARRGVRPESNKRDTSPRLRRSNP